MFILPDDILKQEIYNILTQRGSSFAGYVLYGQISIDDAFNQILTSEERRMIIAKYCPITI